MARPQARHVTTSITLPAVLRSSSIVFDCNPPTSTTKLWLDSETRSGGSKSLCVLKKRSRAPSEHQWSNSGAVRGVQGAGDMLRGGLTDAADQSVVLPPSFVAFAMATRQAEHITSHRIAELATQSQAATMPPRSLRPTKTWPAAAKKISARASSASRATASGHSSRRPTRRGTEKRRPARERISRATPLLVPVKTCDRWVLLFLT